MFVAVLNGTLRHKVSIQILRKIHQEGGLYRSAAGGVCSIEVPDVTQLAGRPFVEYQRTGMDLAEKKKGKGDRQKFHFVHVGRNTNKCCQSS